MIRRALRDGFVIASAAWVAAILAGLVHGQNDALIYWTNRLPDPYTIRSYDALNGFFYSPAFVQAISPLVALPWPLFAAVWTGLLLATLYGLVRHWAVVALLFVPVSIEIYYANVTLLIAAVLVAGMRWPALWAFPILTKVTPGVGLLWFAFRREWRQLAIALVTTVVVVVISFALAPSLWPSWLGLLVGNTDSTVGYPLGPLPARVLIAVVLLWWGARTDRAWVLPLAVLISGARIWLASLAILVAVVPLASRRSISRSPSLRPPKASAFAAPAE